MFRLRTRSILQKIKPVNISRVESINQVNLLSNQIRALSVTPQQERHLWLRKKKAFGHPYLKTHPRHDHHKYVWPNLTNLVLKHIYRKGTSLGDIHDIKRKWSDEAWRHHAEHKRVTRNRARKRKLMNDQKFISGTIIHIFQVDLPM